MPRTRRSSLVGAVLLVALGLFFLYSNFRPGLDPWPLLSRYWPLLLIFLGLGKVLDQFRPRDSQARGAWLSGGEIAVILLLVIAGIALSFQKASRRLHDVQAIDRQGSEAVRVHIKMPAGDLKLSGGANKLMEADFDYDEAEGKPEASYRVSGGTGEIDVTQPGKKFHFGPSHNNWNIRLADDVPMELKVDMGAGQSDLKAGNLSLRRLDIGMGAGQFTADLTGNWKKDLEAEIHGGVGNAVILLPENVGVRVHATGGIGSINSGGLKRNGDEYVNDMYGKSPVTLRLDVSGGVGNIDLRPTPKAQ
jgi:N-terminal domain of toast_rack, DUF2154/LiaF transmembrane domain